jgi:hypothetical protein
MPIALSLLSRTLLAAAMAALLAGCYSQIPVSVSHDQTEQRLMQAAHHWEVLADDVAEQVEDALDDRDDLEELPLDVRAASAADTPFARGFAALLTSRLVSRGLQVAVEPENALTLEFRVLRVVHAERFQRPPMGTFTALAGGVAVTRALTTMTDWIGAGLAAGALADVAVGRYAPYHANEVVISAALVRQNRYVLHDSAIYYINDREWWHYEAPPEPASAPAVTGMDPARGREVWERHAGREQVLEEGPYPQLQEPYRLPPAQPRTEPPGQGAAGPAETGPENFPRLGQPYQVH